VLIFFGQGRKRQGRRQENFPGRRPTGKRPKNSTIKLLSTRSVPCMKFQGDHGPSLPPATDAHRKGASSDADVRTFWCKKLRIFRNLCSVRTRGKGVESVRTREKGVNFLRYCADVFYGRTLITIYPSR